MEFLLVLSISSSDYLFYKAYYRTLINQPAHRAWSFFKIEVLTRRMRHGTISLKVVLVTSDVRRASSYHTEASSCKHISICVDNKRPISCINYNYRLYPQFTRNYTPQNWIISPFSALCSIPHTWSESNAAGRKFYAF